MPSIADQSKASSDEASDRAGAIAQDRGEPVEQPEGVTGA
jgi:hypothetical protein